MVEEVTTQHSICAVVVLYNHGQDSVPRVAGPKPTTLISICAVVVQYNHGQDSVPRVAGPKPTKLISICAVVVQYNHGQDSVPRIAGQKPTMLISIIMCCGGTVQPRSGPACCGTKAYNANFYMCCNGRVC